MLKGILISCFAILVGLGTVTVTAADTVVPSGRVTNHVHVRAAAIGQSQEVGELRPGDQAEYLGDAPHRYHVRLGDRTEGYVSKAWTCRIPSIPPANGGKLAIHFIGVGQGDSKFVIYPKGRGILVDAESLSGAEKDAIRDYILEKLDVHERRINVLLINQPDRDDDNPLPVIRRGIERP